MSEPSAERHEAAADRRARAAGRAAGHALVIVRIVRCAVVDVFAGEVVGVFAHVERADQDGAGGFQPLDQRRVARRRRQVAVDLRSGERRQAGDVEQVLDREWHAGERPDRFAARARGVDRFGAQQRALLGDRGEGVEHRIALANAGERRLTTLRRCCGRTRPRGDFGSRAEIKSLAGTLQASNMFARRFKHGRSGRLGVVGQRECSSTSAAWRKMSRRLNLTPACQAGSSVMPSACAPAATSSARCPRQPRQAVPISAASVSGWTLAAPYSRPCELPWRRFMT